MTEQLDLITILTHTQVIDRVLVHSIFMPVKRCRLRVLKTFSSCTAFTDNTGVLSKYSLSDTHSSHTTPSRVRHGDFDQLWGIGACGLPSGFVHVINPGAETPMKTTLTSCCCRSKRLNGHVTDHSVKDLRRQPLPAPSSHFSRSSRLHVARRCTQPGPS